MMEPHVHPRFFEAYIRGLAGELSVLTLPGKLEYLRMCRSLFMLEPDMAAAFVNALAGDPGFGQSPEAQQGMVYCLERVLEASPLAVSALKIAGKLLDNTEYLRRAEVIEALGFSAQEERHLDALTYGGRDQEEEAFLLATLSAKPMHVGAADRLLRMDTRQGRDGLSWLNSFQCPRPLRDSWVARLYLHYARRGLVDRALELWPKLEKGTLGAYTLVRASEVFIMTGERELGIALLHKALKQDSTLEPARLRLRELLHPTPIDSGLPERLETTICLFSWNKAVDLERTLRSLAVSRLGRARVRMLLNGCTDDSRERVDAVIQSFGQTDFQVIELPVNVGVAAARNWLLSLPETRQAEYVVFADDDVVVPKDWLAKLLSVAEADPRVAVVGGKAVHPAVGPGPGRLQYLYRMAGLTLPGLFKLTPGDPGSGVCDTGLYSFTRPCLTVMGCLVALRNSILREVGPYDIRFNPSQVEDIDHDLEACLKGYRVMYRGDLSVIHYRNSSSDPKSPATIWLNHLKMSCKRQPDAVQLRDLSKDLI